MKLKSTALFLFFISIIFLVFIVIKKFPVKKNSIAVFYEKNIDKMPIEQLKNLRSLNADEKRFLYEKLKILDIFSIDKITDSIKTIPEPQIILWFTDHFGRVPVKGLDWYSKNVFSRFTNQSATFWLIDLAAWRYLAIKEEQLKESDDFISFLTRGKSFDCKECPLLLDQSNLFPQTLEVTSKAKFLRASDFFIWLSTCNPQLSLISSNTLVRDDLRPDAARFALRQLGFYSPLLTSYEKNGISLVDLDNSQVFPLLQYLEALYYALQIIKENEYKKTCNIVFLLPNKEFTYYLVQNESKPFETFKNDLNSLVQRTMNASDLKIAVYFYPFSYGSSFYDQPFEADGRHVTATELKNRLNNILN